LTLIIIVVVLEFRVLTVSSYLFIITIYPYVIMWASWNKIKICLIIDLMVKRNKQITEMITKRLLWDSEKRIHECLFIFVFKY